MPILSTRDSSSHSLKKIITAQQSFAPPFLGFAASGGARSCETQIFLAKEGEVRVSRRSPLREIMGLLRISVVEAGGEIGGVGVVELHEAVGVGQDGAEVKPVE